MSRSYPSSRVMLLIVLSAVSCSLVRADAYHRSTPTLLRTGVDFHHGVNIRHLEESNNDNADDVGNDDNVESYGDDVVQNIEQGTKQTFWNMFNSAPSDWTATQWGVFAGLMTLFGFLFGVCCFCWCITVFIPRCCGNKAPMVYAAMV